MLNISASDACSVSRHKTYLRTTIQPTAHDQNIYKHFCAQWTRRTKSLGYTQDFDMFHSVHGHAHAFFGLYSECLQSCELVLRCIHEFPNDKLFRDKEIKYNTKKWSKIVAIDFQYAFHMWHSRSNSSTFVCLFDL